MYGIIKPLLFAQDAERAHDMTISALKATQRTPLAALYRQSLPQKPVTVAGLEFANPVGLAAGLDKNGECIDAFAAMGFGFIEVGTVTPEPQGGNDKPRLFRLPEVRGIINRMGFNNKGVDYLVENVKRAKFKGVLGINIGKNKTTPEERALDDYLLCMDKVYPLASYITINISSPNTPGLRDLQHGDALTALLQGIKQRQAALHQQHGKYVPLWVKIAPDLTEQEIIIMADSLLSNGMDGVIATNTTLDRQKVSHLLHGQEAGGLSGEPLTDKSLAVTRSLAKHLDGRLPIISVGGIHDSESALARLDAGASLVQCYTSFIYQGPGLIKSIVNAL